MTEVPRVQTTTTAQGYAHAVIRAWMALLGTIPTKEQVGVLWGQWMVETSGRACWNWNVGNVKISQAQVDAGLPWFDLPGTWEIVGGKRVVLPDGDPGRRFRAYASLDVAMREHLAFLRGKRYAPSWPFVEAGDPDGFARALKRQGYYTAPADDYARILVASHARWMGMTAYEDALAEVRSEDSRDTEPAILRADQLEPEPAIIHPWVYDGPVRLEPETD
jgi:hypothetical protein